MITEVKVDKKRFKQDQWRNEVALANMAPLGGKKAPSSGAPRKM